MDKTPEQLRKEKCDLEERLTLVRDELTRIRKEERKTLIPIYENKVTVMRREQEGPFNKIRIGEEYVVVTSTLINSDVFNEHLDRFGLIDSPPENNRRSVRYYVRYGVLFRDGGGYLTLKDEQPCSDEEWERIKSGDIPEKFLKQ